MSSPTRRPIPLFWLLPAALLSLGADAPTYEKDLKPLFVKRCTICHNARKADNAEVSGGLALDSYEGVLKGTGQQKIIEAKNPDASSLFTRLTDGDPEIRMPRDDDPLPASDKDLIKRWIEAGAPRGDAARSADTSSARRRVVRSLDVVIPFEKPAEKPTGRTTPGEVKLKVGPLPSSTAVALRADGKRLAAGSYGEVVVWDLDKREPVFLLDDFPGSVSALLFIDGGKTLVAAGGLPGRSGELRLCDAETGKTLRRLEGHEEVVTSVAVRPDGKQLASSSFDGTVRFWDPTGKTPPKMFKGHSDFVYDVAYMPDGKSVLSVSKDRSVKRVNSETAKEIKTYTDHNEAVYAVAVRPDGKEFITAGEESSMRVWSPDAEKPTKRVGAGGPIHQLAISARNGVLASASGDRTARVFKAATWVADKTLLGPTEWQYCVATDEAGKVVAAGGWDGLVRVWDLGDKVLKPRLVVIAPPSASPSEHGWVSVAGDGRILASPDLTPMIRRFEAGKEVKSTPATTAEKGKKK